MTWPDPPQIPPGGPKADAVWDIEDETINQDGTREVRTRVVRKARLISVATFCAACATAHYGWPCPKGSTP